jgi:sugar-specific transcriptional regulator TrmB
MSEIVDKYREEAKEVATAAHGAARDDRDARQDGLTDRLLRMYDKIQDALLLNMTTQEDTVRDIKESIARVEKKVAEFVSAFPDGDVAGHLKDHETRIEEAKDKKVFWEKIKFTLAALALTAAASWIGVVAWKAFLIGPK